MIGPFILRDTMNGLRYLDMFQEQVWPVISNGKMRWMNLLFMQMENPSSLSPRCQENKDRHRWFLLGRGGQSKALNPCDLFFWGRAKEEFYRTRPKILMDNDWRNVLPTPEFTWNWINKLFKLKKPYGFSFVYMLIQNSNVNNWRFGLRNKLGIYL